VAVPVVAAYVPAAHPVHALAAAALYEPTAQLMQIEAAAAL